MTMQSVVPGLAQTSSTGFFDGIEEGLSSAWQEVVAFSPKLLGALIVLFVGWILAKFVRGSFRRVFHGIGLDRLLEQAGLADALSRAGHTASGAIAQVAYWIALLITFLMAAQTLQVESLTILLAGLIGYLPLVIVAIITIVVSAAVGRFLADLIAPFSATQRVRWLPTTVRVSVIGFGGFAALNTLNLADEIVNTLFIGLVGTVGLTIVVALGVGGIKAAEEWWREILPSRRPEKSFQTAGHSN